VGCVNSIACTKTADLQAEPTLRTPQGISTCLWGSKSRFGTETRVSAPYTQRPRLRAVVSGRAASEQRGAAGKWRRREGEGGLS